MSEKVQVDRKIILDKYDLNWLIPDQMIVCIGPTNSGKTKLGWDICWHLRKHIPLGCVFSKTAEANSDYKKIFPGLFIHEQFKPKILERMINQRKRLFAFFKQRNQEAIKKYNINERVLFVADDCMADKTWQKEESTRSMFFEGRHYGFTFLFMMQYPLSIQPDERGQLKKIFLFPADDPGTTERYFDHYAKGIVPDKRTFKKIMERLAQPDEFDEDGEPIKPHRCLVIDRDKQGTDWRDKCFWFQCEVRHRFPFNSEIAWEYHQKNYCKNWLVRDQMKKKKDSHSREAPVDSDGFRIILDDGKEK